MRGEEVLLDILVKMISLKREVILGLKGIVSAFVASDSLIGTARVHHAQDGEGVRADTHGEEPDKRHTDAGEDQKERYIFRITHTSAKDHYVKRQ